MTTLPDTTKGEIIVSLVSLLAGALITTIITRLSNKTKRLRYSTRTERLALSADDPIFGSVRVTWASREVRNLYLVSVEVENSSNVDFENVDLKIYVETQTNLLGERTSVTGSPYIVNWSDAYGLQLAVPAGAQPTPQQMEIYLHNREYLVPVLNRGQVLNFSYLCTRADDAQPGVFVSTQLKGARLFHEVRANFVWGVPIQRAVIRGLLASAVTLVLCGLFLRGTWEASGVCIVVGLFAQHVGAIMYQAERWISRIISG